MARTRKVALIVGSLRRDAFSRQLAHALIELAPPTLAPAIVEIGALPLYNPDLEAGGPPAPWAEFRAAMKAAEAVLFVTPEGKLAKDETREFLRKFMAAFADWVERNAKR